MKSLEKSLLTSLRKVSTPFAMGNTVHDVYACAQVLPGEVSVVSKREGSVRLVLRLPQSGAERLLEAIGRGALRAHGVVDAEHYKTGNVPLPAQSPKQHTQADLSASERRSTRMIQRVEDPNCDLATYRVRLGLTLKGMSNMTGLSLSTLSRIERGIGRASARTVNRLKDGLGLPEDMIVRLVSNSMRTRKGTPRLLIKA